MARKARQQPPSQRRRAQVPAYDVPMIRDFLGHLLSELRISHYEWVRAARGEPNPVSQPLVDELSAWERRRPALGLLLTVYSPADLPENVRRAWARKRADRRDEQLRHLEALASLFDEALTCAAVPALVTVRHSAEDIAAELAGGNSDNPA